MAIDFRSVWGSNKCEKSDINKRVVDATEVVMRACQTIGNLVAPKMFKCIGFTLLQFDRKPSSGSRHSMKIMHGDSDDYCKTVDETVVWQVTGYVGDPKDKNMINVVIRHIFHTFDGDRSGNGETFINGKPLIKPEYGGLVLEILAKYLSDRDYWIKQQKDGSINDFQLGLELHSEMEICADRIMESK